ncbi:MAG: 1,2-phenylacetyl-CoA epoxidase subunit PaaD [Phycisphaerae bacterium]|nr:1,2-phenylacetyl-CoA epoxidase subunit PaaD [Phycisphaerae bacterium]
MTSLDQTIRTALHAIDDPEMPISIVDLGLITDIRLSATAGEPAAVEIDLTPTFIGCPALDMIRDQVARRVAALPGVGAVRVNWVNAPRWSVDRISDAGRERLRSHGVTTPDRRSGGCCGGGGSEAAATKLVPLTVSLPRAQDVETPQCPYCRSTETTMESPFGPTRCRSIFYCPACRNSFEHLRPI